MGKNLIKARKQKLDKLVDEKAKEYKERLLSGESIRDIKKDTDRVEEYIIKSGDEIVKCFMANRKCMGFSPIEELFYFSFLKLKAMGELCMSDIKLAHNYKVVCGGSKYRIDFIFYTNTTPPIDHNNLLIELDGHLWHEKTPEQVENDKRRERKLISNGFTIFRYSGRELWKDPDKCVLEAFEQYISKF